MQFNFYKRLSHIAALNSIARYLIVFFVIPNVALALLKQVVFLYRPLINIDYLVIGGLSVWLPVLMKSLAIGLVAAIDILIALGPTFHFSVKSVLTSLKGLAALDTSLVTMLLFLSIFSITLFAYSCVKWLPRSKQFRLASSIVLCSLAAAALWVDRQISDGRYPELVPNNLVGANIATTPLGRIIKVAVLDRNSVQDEFAIQMPSAMNVHWGNSDISKSNNIVLVLVESLGLPLNKNDRFLSNYFASQELADVYEIKQGVIETNGSTVSGEFRELCGRKIGSIKIQRHAWLDECIPNILRKRGFQTTAIHGFVGSFFERQLWYPWIGFENSLFAKELQYKIPARKTCGRLFPGICDLDAVGYIAKLLERGAEQNKKQFIYWLTLNAHLPVWLPMDIAINSNCPPKDTICKHMQLHQHVFAQLEKLALSKKLKEKPTMIIVGDHPPPFATLELRGKFDATKVPYWIISPRPLGKSGHSGY